MELKSSREIFTSSIGSLSAKLRQVPCHFTALVFMSPLCLQGLLPMAQRPPRPAWTSGMEGWAQSWGTAAHSCPSPEEREPQGTALVSVTLGSRCPSSTSLFSTRCGGFVTPGSPCRAPLQGAQLWFLLNLKVWDTAIPGDAHALGQALFPTALPERSGGALELSVPCSPPAVGHRATPERCWLPKAASRTPHKDS